MIQEPYVQGGSTRSVDDLIPGHGDPTVNLCDRYVCVRGNRVEQV